MANDKQEGGKAPARVQTVNIKVFIHCQGCKKKVRKLLKRIDGVHNVEVDAALGKVTVTGTVDSKFLLRKLEKSGKFAQLWPEGKDIKGQQKQEKKEVREEKSEGKDEDKKGKGDAAKSDGTGKGNGNNADVEDGDKGDANATANGEGGKKKKKGGGGGGGGDSADGGGSFDQAGSSKTTTNKSVAPTMVETGYSLASAEYATHMFSDENANNCSLM